MNEAPKTTLKVLAVGSALLVLAIVVLTAGFSFFFGSKFGLMFDPRLLAPDGGAATDGGDAHVPPHETAADR